MSFPFSPRKQKEKSYFLQVMELDRTFSVPGKALDLDIKISRLEKNHKTLLYAKKKVIEFLRERQA